MKNIKMNLKEAYQETRLFSLQMVKPLQTEDFVLQAAAFASPPKWNLDPTNSFLEEWIRSKFQSDYQVFLVGPI